ncbi:MAG: ferritin-like domain-containing protein [Bauldia sp.]|nr:ferritin-like domain-containing protein [Bauldia sp.]
MQHLFHETLQDVYYAEKQLVKTLKKLSKTATAPELQTAFADHMAETETHVERLETVFELIGEKPRAKKCPAIIGIIEEGDEVAAEAEDPAVRDVGIIAAAQAAEHYEIARYGTLCEWAKTLGYTEAKEILGQTLEEEKNADMLLTQIAEGGVNQAGERVAA